MKSRTDSRKFKTMSRRELLKLTPVVALGAFAIPRLQKPLLKGGLCAPQEVHTHIKRCNSRVRR